MQVRTIVCGLLGALSFACTAPADGGGAEVADYEAEISFGERIREGDYPGAIVWKTPDFRLGTSGFLCSGTVVGRRHFLTAAHCVYAVREIEVTSKGETWTQQRIRPDVDRRVRPGATIQASGKPSLPAYEPRGWSTVTIAATHIADELLARAAAGYLGWSMLLDEAIPDLAIVETQEDLRGLAGTAKIDLAPVARGERLHQVGFGCRRETADANYQSVNDWADKVTGEVGRTRAIDASETFAILEAADPAWRSWWPRARKNLADGGAGYVFMPGPGSAKNQIALCPGDSGGGLYRPGSVDLVGVASGNFLLVPGKPAYWSQSSRLDRAPTERFLRKVLDPSSFR
jgi:hypothetical protein